MRVSALLAESAAALGQAGIESPEWDAERLVRHALGWDRARLLARESEAVDPEVVSRVRSLVGERARRVPLQHLVGSQPFWRSEFVVGPAVLVPRPETELLVETALELLRGTERPLVVDVGTGSGCIALSLALERPDAVVHATELSLPALEVARENERRLAPGRVAFHLGDLLEPVASLAGRFDLVVSNPPYVDPASRASLPPEVRDHDPAVALFPRGSAVSLYRRLAPAAARALRPTGALAVEISPGLATAVGDLLADAGFAPPTVLPDLAGRPRVVHARAGAAPSPGAVK
jgi:release factor glutamine methyltransferase